jgi:hypothetical protein
VVLLLIKNGKAFFVSPQRSGLPAGQRLGDSPDFCGMPPLTGLVSNDNDFHKDSDEFEGLSMKDIITSLVGF